MKRTEKMSKFSKFHVELDSFIDELKEKIEQNNKKVEELLLLEKKDYTNFVKPLEMMSEKMARFFTPLSHVNAVNNSEKSQEVYAQSLPLITQYSTELSQNIGFTEHIKR